MSGNLEHPDEVSDVTIVVLSYNNSRWLVDCLNSVLRQPGVRLVVIDDGSTDDSRDVATAWAEEYCPTADLRLHIENRGLVARANEALDLVETEFYQLLGSDDELVDGKLSRQLMQMRADPSIALSFSDMEIIDSEGATLESSYISAAAGRGAPDPSATNAAARLLSGAPFSAPTWLIRTKCARVVGGYDTRFHQEDVPMFLRLATRFSIAQVAEPLVRYRRHGASLSAQGIPVSAESVVAWCELLIEVREDVADDAAWLPQFRRRAFQAVFSSRSDIDRDSRVRFARVLAGIDRESWAKRCKAVLVLMVAVLGIGRHVTLIRGALAHRGKVIGGRRSRFDSGARR